MPISITLTEGVIPTDKVGLAVEKVTESFLKHSPERVSVPHVAKHIAARPDLFAQSVADNRSPERFAEAFPALPHPARVAPRPADRDH